MMLKTALLGVVNAMVTTPQTVATSVAPSRRHSPTQPADPFNGPHNLTLAATRLPLMTPILPWSPSQDGHPGGRLAGRRGRGPYYILCPGGYTASSDELIAGSPPSQESSEGELVTEVPSPNSTDRDHFSCVPQHNSENTGHCASCSLQGPLPIKLRHGKKCH